MLHRSIDFIISDHIACDDPGHHIVLTLVINARHPRIQPIIMVAMGAETEDLQLAEKVVVGKYMSFWREFKGFT